MNLHYDKAADALYVEVSEGFAARQEQIDQGTIVDLDEHGHVVGIEVIRPARHWPVEEILQRFDLDADAAAVLRSLWPAKPGARLPFAEPLPA